jgi:pyruvate kinase
VFTRRGNMPVQTALLRPHSCVHAFAPDAATCRKINLSRGVVARQIDFEGGQDAMLSRAIKVLKDEAAVKEGTPLVVISDMVQKGQVVDSVLLIHA